MSGEIDPLRSALDELAKVRHENTDAKKAKQGDGNKKVTQECLYTYELQGKGWAMQMPVYKETTTDNGEATIAYKYTMDVAVRVPDPGKPKTASVWDQTTLNNANDSASETIARAFAMAQNERWNNGDFNPPWLLRQIDLP